MLSLHRISRLVESCDPSRLWTDLAGSGLAWPLPLRVRLESVPAAAWALALRRVCELTHGSTALADQLTERLLHAQQPHGAWARENARGVTQDDPLTTALAAAAIRRRLAQPGIEQRPEAAGLRHAYAAALAALAQMQQAADGLFGDAVGPDAGLTVGRTPLRVAEACFILFFLAEDPAALSALRLVPLRDAVDAHAAAFDATLRDTFDMAGLLLDHPATSTAGPGSGAEAASVLPFGTLAA